MKIESRENWNQGRNMHGPALMESLQVRLAFFRPQVHKVEWAQMQRGHVKSRELAIPTCHCCWPNPSANERSYSCITKLWCSRDRALLNNLRAEAASMNPIFTRARSRDANIKSTSCQFRTFLKVEMSVRWLYLLCD
jgi:hypothetical protein